MNSSASFLSRLVALWIGAWLLAVMPARAQEAAAPASAPAVSDEPLVITNGKFTSEGHSMPATIKNLVELIQRRYRGVNVTVVGVEDVVIEHLTLHWARTKKISDNGIPVMQNGVPIMQDPPLFGVLAALSNASGRKFVPDNFGANDFVLHKREEDRTSSQQTEVFNLSPFLTQGSRRAASLEEQLRQLQLELTVLQKRYAEKHPTVIDLTARIEAVKASLAEVNKSAGDVKDAAIKLMDQIRDVVENTLASQNGNEKPPVFQFHPGSNLLVVIGSDTAVNITRKVIAALEKNQ